LANEFDSLLRRKYGSKFSCPKLDVADTIVGLKFALPAFWHGSDTGLIKVLFEPIACIAAIG
jgi:hypothetical protein